MHRMIWGERFSHLETRFQKNGWVYFRLRVRNLTYFGRTRVRREQIDENGLQVLNVQVWRRNSWRTCTLARQKTICPELGNHGIIT